MNTYSSQLEQLSRQGNLRSLPAVDAQGLSIVRDGNTMLNFSSNDYLGPVSYTHIDVYKRQGVHIYTVFHHTGPQERLGENSCFWKSLTKPVNIGKNVWIGGGSIILPGVTIGDGTTIGAGSVVTKSIPANCIAVGNPCKVIKDNL